MWGMGAPDSLPAPPPVVPTAAVDRLADLEPPAAPAFDRTLLLVGLQSESIESVQREGERRYPLCFALRDILVVDTRGRPLHVDTSVIDSPSHCASYRRQERAHATTHTKRERRNNVFLFKPLLHWTVTTPFPFQTALKTTHSRP